jgi:hypothetical protein
MQHRSLPVHGMGYPCESVGPNLRYRAVPTFDVARLQGAKIKPALLTEMNGKGETLDLTPLIRDYLEGLAHIHESMRELASAQVVGWDGVLASTQAKGAEPNGGDPKSAVLALELDDTDKVIDTVQVFTDLTDYRRTFERRNRILTALTRRYVSSEHVE